MGKYNPAPYQLDLNRYPHLVTDTIPGPKSKELHARAAKYYRGLSGQVKLFPVAFERGSGCMLEDVDGNQYIDFSSGIYVTTLGHCHPKISEGVAKYAKQLMNAHDFTTEIKVRLLEKMASVLPGDLKCFQLYDSGTTAVEAGLRTCRAATGKHEFISCFMDFHGKSGHSIGLARMTKFSGSARPEGFYLVPRPDTYRPWWTRPDGTLDTERYLEFYDKFIRESTTGQVAAFVLEPIQGWGGSIMPPDDFFPKLRKFLDERNILLFADEVLTSMGRTGKILCCEHWNVLPDVVTMGKGFGNGFPVTCMAVRTPYADAVDKISADQLRRQSDGVRRSSRLLRGHRRRRTAGTCAGAGGSLQEAHGGLDHEIQNRRRHPLQGMSARHRTGQGQSPQNPVRRSGKDGLPESIRQGARISCV